MLFFVIINMIALLVSLGSIFETIQTNAELLQWYGGEFRTALTIEILGSVVFLVSLVFCVLWIIQIFQRKPLFLRFLQIEAIIGVAAQIIMLIAVYIVRHYIELDMSTTIGMLTGGIAGFFLWTLYFCKSVRVRTYMGSDEHMSKALFAYRQ